MNVTRVKQDRKSNRMLPILYGKQVGRSISVTIGEYLKT